MKIETDQILVILQRLEETSNSTTFNNNMNKISKLPKSLSITLSTFDVKCEKFELFKDIFQTNLRFHNQQTEDDKILIFHCLSRIDSLQTFRNISRPNRENLGNLGTFLVAFSRKNVKVLSKATAKHRVRKPQLRRFSPNQDLTIRPTLRQKVKDRLVITPMTSFGKEQLSPSPTKELLAAVERITLTVSSRKH